MAQCDAVTADWPLSSDRGLEQLREVWTQRIFKGREGGMEDDSVWTDKLKTRLDILDRCHHLYAD